MLVLHDVLIGRWITDFFTGIAALAFYVRLFASITTCAFVFHSLLALLHPHFVLCM